MNIVKTFTSTDSITQALELISNYPLGERLFFT